MARLTRPGATTLELHTFRPHYLHVCTVLRHPVCMYMYNAQKEGITVDVLTALRHPLHEPAQRTGVVVNFRPEIGPTQFAEHILDLHRLSRQF